MLFEKLFRSRRARLLSALKAGEGMGLDDRYKIGRALAQEGERAIKPLISLLEDTDFSLHLAVRATLADIGEPAIAPLIKTTGHRNKWVREGAADALGRIGNPRAAPCLLELLKDREPKVRIEAAKGLGEIGDPQSTGPLRRALTDEEHFVRLAAAGSLRRLEWEPETEEEKGAFIVAKETRDVINTHYQDAIALGSAAVEPLIIAVKSRDWVLQEYAARALGDIGDARARKPLEELLSGGDWKVKEAARIALEKIEHRWSPVPLALGVIEKKGCQPNGEDRKKNRFGKCKTCGSIVELTASKEIYEDWEGVDAYLYFCSVCYRTGNRYLGRLLDRYGENLLDQYVD